MDSEDVRKRKRDDSGLGNHPASQPSNVATSTLGTDEKQEKKKKTNKDEVQEEETKQKQTPGKAASKLKFDPAGRRTYPGGLLAVDYHLGDPDAKRASHGKNVSVNYIGKLLKTGETYDSNEGKEPLKFCVGAGEVMEGLDICVEGMHVGDYSTLTIPPDKGYGAEWKDEVVPPNSWLHFEVELIDVED